MAHHGTHTGTMDFKSAFLYANLKEEDHCYARIPKSESELLIEADSKWKEFLHSDGCIFVKVVGALYGHPAAPALWYDYLKDKLALLGFTPLVCEPCIFIRTSKGHLEIIGIHVDDLIIGSKDLRIFDELKAF